VGSGSPATRACWKSSAKVARASVSRSSVWFMAALWGEPRRRASRDRPGAPPYNWPMNPAANLILVGPTGAGQPCIGRRLAEHYGLRLVDLDRAIERCTGAAIPVIFDCEGEAGFRAHESAALADALSGKGPAENGMVLAVGAGAVLDRDNRRLMRE